MQRRTMEPIVATFPLTVALASSCVCGTGETSGSPQRDVIGISNIVAHPALSIKSEWEISIGALSDTYEFSKQLSGGISQERRR